MILSLLARRPARMIRRALSLLPGIEFWAEVIDFKEQEMIPDGARKCFPGPSAEPGRYGLPGNPEKRYHYAVIRWTRSLDAHEFRREKRCEKHSMPMNRWDVGTKTWGLMVRNFAEICASRLTLCIGLYKENDD